jgi:hypothetical protein
MRLAPQPNPAPENGRGAEQLYQSKNRLVKKEALPTEIGRAELLVRLYIYGKGTASLGL